MKKVVSLVQFFLLFCMVSVGLSDPYAYDGFDYEPGQLLGASNDTLGFTGTWQAGGGAATQCTVIADSLDYPGVDTAVQLDSGALQVIVPNFEGGRIGRYLEFDPNSTIVDYVNDNNALGVSGKTIYISFLMKTSVTTPFYGFELKRDNLDDSGAILYIGNDMAGSELQVCAFRDRNTDPSNIGVHLNYLGTATTNTELFVVKIDFQDDGDDVTVYREPSLEDEPVKAPDLVNAGDLSFNAFTFAAWVDPAGRTVQFDEICMGTTYRDVVRFYEKASRAKVVSPVDGAVDIQTSESVTLNWNPGIGVSVEGYEVYFSDNFKAVVAGYDSAFIGTTTATSIDVSGLTTDKTYYWSIAETFADPNYIPGAIWSFDTEKTYPVVVSQPVPQSVFAGVDVSFTFAVNSVSPLTYQWYDQYGVVVDGGNVSGAQTETLTIGSVQIADEDSYYCQVVNSAGSVDSALAALKVKRLVGYWDLDDPGSSDPEELWLDNSASGNDLMAAYTVPESFTWADGADGTPAGAVLLDGKFGLGTKKADGTMNDIPVGNDPYSVSFWFKGGVQASGVGLFGWGNYGSYSQTNSFAIWPSSPNRIQNYWWDNDLNAELSYSLQDDTWHNVVSTYDSVTRTVYVDGLKVVSDTPAPHNVQSSENFMIGKTTMSAETFEFVGAMDEVKVFNYAITASDVAEHYTAFTGESICLSKPVYDFNDDCKVDLSDIADMMAEWLTCGIYPDCINSIE